MATNCSSRPKAGKPQHNRPPKPYKGFPLYAHPVGYWAKKIKGKLCYFGRWGHVRNGKMERLSDDGWAKALEQFKAEYEDLLAGRTPRVKDKDGRLTVRDLCNRFLTAKLRQLEAGDIGRRMFEEYRSTTARLVSQFGKNRPVDDLAANDFEVLRADLSKQYGPVRIGNEVQKVRTVFKYGYEAGLIDKPVRFGPQFKKPSASVLRRHRAKNGERMLDANECNQLLDAAPVQLKAMVLLGLNCGFGNHDVATLPLSALDLDAGWVDYARPKTGIERRCPLWVETIESLRAALVERPQPRQDEAKPLVFVTTRGRPWLSGGIANPVSVAARKLLRELGINSRKGLGFYTLRHVFRTVADGARDQVAANAIMGHADPSMGGVYREHIDDARLVAVTDHVHTWLFGAEGGAA